MSLAVIMLVHTALDRAEQVARHWSAAGCPVVIHVDKKVPKRIFEPFCRRLADVEDISFSQRFRCEWGTWGIVAATQSAAEMLLRTHPVVNHVYLASGACLPLRPVEELVEYLAERPQTDFVESATTADVPWTMGGLDSERFSLRFPFAWKKQRFLFDRFVQLQRLLRVNREVPRGLVPHMGSQWWCLTRKTLTAILTDPDRNVFDRYFSRVWIPDESYFQTMARQYATKIESRSLTLSKFDFQGKPHIFYDDHLQLLRRSDCFVARKIWPQADTLYRAFLTDATTAMSRTEPNPAKIDRIFAKAVDRRVRGRPGLYMQSRFPQRDIENTPTAAPFTMFQGFAELFEDFEPWLAKMTGARVHGHIFAPDRAYFAEDEPTINGALSDNALLRDYNPRAFLTNLLWNTRGDYQCFQFGPADNQVINWDIAKDANAHVWVISGAWAVPLYHSTDDFDTLRREAARLQKIESEHLKVLRSPWVKARVQIWTMSEFVEAPMEPLQAIVDKIGAAAPRRLTEAPCMADLTYFGRFLQSLKNQGMHPYLMGDFPVTPGQPDTPPRARPRPYLVR